MIPVTAVLIGALILGEQLLLRHFAGMILIGLSLGAIDGRIVRLLRLAE
jgi:drug/metabolite transporter (DMT)-like permease